MTARPSPKDGSQDSRVTVERSPIGQNAKLNELIVLAMLAAAHELGQGYEQAVLEKHADHAANLWREHEAFCASRPSAAASGDDELVRAVEQGQIALEAWENFRRAREAMNAARPDLEATPAERALYDERYQADHKAERAHWTHALNLVVNGAVRTMVEALASRPSAAASGDDPWLNNCVLGDECGNIEALTRAQPLGGDELLAVADRLIDQQDEPWPGIESDRLHYWRDKAIKAADDIRAALTEQNQHPHAARAS